MPKRMIVGTIIGLMRDGKLFEPVVGTEIELSNEEIKAIEAVDPNLIRTPEPKGKGSAKDSGMQSMADDPANQGDPVNSLVAGGGSPADNGAVAGENPNPKAAVKSKGVTVAGAKGSTEGDVAGSDEL